MRKYEPIWKQLKEKKTAKVVVSKNARKTVKKAVIKEKDMDIAFKIECDEIYGAGYKLHIKEDERCIIFNLRLPWEYDL